MALLFSDVAEEYAHKFQAHEDKLSANVSDLFDVIDNPEGLIEDDTLPQETFISSVANEYYKKSIEDINNTQIGNKAVRRKNFQQIMKESFFYGANRFGNNFIA